MPSIVERVVAAVGAFRSGAPAPAPVASPIVTRASEPKTSEIVAAGAPNADRYPKLFGPSITPGVVSNALRRADRGYMRALCELLAEQRETCTHLQSQLEKREKALARCKSVVLPASTKGQGKRAEKQAAKIADHVAMRLDALDGFSDGVEHLQGALYYGRSALEIVWFRDARGVGVRCLESIEPQRLSYAKNWRIHLYDEAGNDLNPALGKYPGVDIREEWPDKFVIHEPRTLGPVTRTRQGLGRVLVWAAMFWKWDAKDWLAFAELFAKPWRIGTFAKGSDPDDIEALKEALIQLSGYTTGVFPEGCKPEFIHPTNNSKTHADIARFWTEEISKVVSGGTMGSQMSGSSGSRAAAEVHEREEQKLTAGDGVSMDATLRRDLARAIVRKNFGDEAAELYTPYIHLVTEPPADLDNEANRAIAFIDRGGAVDEDEYRAKYTGLTKPDAGAKLLSPAGPKSAPGNESDGDEENDDAKPEPDGDGEQDDAGDEDEAA